MLLAQGTPSFVYQNLVNGSFYRLDGLLPERNAVRIWPLEVFPNGMLIAKPMRTNVGDKTQVEQVGPWVDGMKTSEPWPDRAPFEKELVDAERELQIHQQVYDRLPLNGKGKMSRGSYKNKIINLERRIGTLKTGLDLVVQEVACCSVRLKGESRALFPSGEIATVRGYQVIGGKVYAQVRPQSMQKFGRTTLVPEEVLTPLPSALPAAFSLL